MSESSEFASRTLILSVALEMELVFFLAVSSARALEDGRSHG